jgi:hypothetical protein
MVVGVSGLEPETSILSGSRSNLLSYTPVQAATPCHLMGAAIVRMLVIVDSQAVPRKEVIQPHLPVRLPCYDFVPVAKPTLGRCPPCGLAHGLQVFPTPMT